MNNEDNIYHGKDGRLRVYVKETKKTISYPKYLMQKELGRELLPDEHVHHIDENPLNNDISNLKVMSNSDHAREHMQKFFDTTAMCAWCGKEFLWTAKHQKNFYSNKRRREQQSEMPFCSRECSGRYGRQIQLKNASDVSTLRKLTDDQVRYIREHYVPYNTNCGVRALARQFDVDKSVIEKIVQRQTYKDVL